MSDIIFSIILQYYLLHGNSISGRRHTLEAIRYVSAECTNDDPRGELLRDVRKHVKEYLNGERECKQ